MEWIWTDKAARGGLSLLVFIIIAGCGRIREPESVYPVPSERQLAWHRMEFYGFVHFGPNTFLDQEWGYGDARPEDFYPTALDCEQWVRVAREAGMTGIILTAKHHDGFCLWPSAYTEYSVKSSPWRGGAGDVVGDLAAACLKHGLKMGLYLSPWDRHHPEYGGTGYLTYYRNQLRELLTNYGPVFEVWFDGANGGDGFYGGARETRRIDRKTYYDWQETWRIVRELQPDAVIFSDAGPDIRWVGNEQGWANPENWSLLRRDEVWPGWPHYVQLRSGHEYGTHWVPAEADVSIRPGWFYHPDQDDDVKTLDHLLDIYYLSVGRNASLLLNLPVDRRGLVHEVDARRLRELGEAIRADFAIDLALGKAAEASNERGKSRRFGSAKAVDGRWETFWSTDDGIHTGIITVDLGSSVEVNRVLLQECIRLGQRVKAFVVEAWMDREWQTITRGTTIGYKRILRFPPVQTSKVRLKITDARACPTIASLELYRALEREGE